MTRASDLGHRAQYAQLAGELPALREELTAATHTTEERELFALLSEAHTGVTAIAYTLGYFDLRSLVAERINEVACLEVDTPEELRALLWEAASR